MKKSEGNMKSNHTRGITLVALVVTIVVLLILAGITLVYVFGYNSVFKQASEAKLKTDIAQWQERLEMAKSPVFIEGLGTFNPDKYFDYIQGQGIINKKDTDVIDNEDGTYDVTTKPGYVFLVTLMPNLAKPTDAEIEYIGQAGKIAPIIKKLDVSATSSSITGKAVVARIENGTIKYYYKFTSVDDSTYTEITNVNAETGATQNTGITAGESYTIKVVAKNEIGETEKIAEITVMRPITKDTITSDETSWEAINRVATAIANDSTITNESTKATGTTERGEYYEISVGDIYKVQWMGTDYRVRVLGFKHDDLVESSSYGVATTKASISFEFYDCLRKHKMNGTSSSDSTNKNGWATTEMRTFLEGSNGIGQLSNKNYIKQVKKKYIKTYGDVSSVTTSNDNLWLLSASEVLKDGYNGGDTRGEAITTEGEQYLYYKNNATESYNVDSPNRVKYNSGIATSWWVRSPQYCYNYSFLYISDSRHGRGGAVLRL